MTAYAFAHLRPTDGPVEDEVLSCIERIQATTRHLDGDVVIVPGVGPEYDASATAAEMRAARERVPG